MENKKIANIVFYNFDDFTGERRQAAIFYEDGTVASVLPEEAVEACGELVKERNITSPNAFETLINDNLVHVVSGEEFERNFKSYFGNKEDENDIVVIDTPEEYNDMDLPSEETDEDDIVVIDTPEEYNDMDLPRDREVLRETPTTEVVPVVDADAPRRTTSDEVTPVTDREVPRETPTTEVVPVVDADVPRETSTEEVTPVTDREVPRETPTTEVVPVVDTDVPRRTTTEEVTPVTDREVPRETPTEEVTPVTDREVPRETPTTEVTPVVDADAPRRTTTEEVTPVTDGETPRETPTTEVTPVTDGETPRETPTDEVTPVTDREAPEETPTDEVTPEADEDTATEEDEIEETRRPSLLERFKDKVSNLAPVKFIKRQATKLKNSKLGVRVATGVLAVLMTLGIYSCSAKNTKKGELRNNDVTTSQNYDSEDNNLDDLTVITKNADFSTMSSDELIDATSSITQKNTMSDLKTMMKEYNKDFANRHKDDSKKIKAGLSFEEITAMQQAFNDFSDDEIAEFYNGSKMTKTELSKNFKEATNQLAKAHVIEDRTTQIDISNIIDEEDGVNFYQKYHEMFMKTKEAEGTDKINSINDFYNSVKEEFDGKQEVESYKLSIIPMVKAANEMYKNYDISKEARDYQLQLMNNDNLEDYANETFENVEFVTSNSITQDIIPLYNHFKQTIVREMKNDDAYSIANVNRDLGKLDEYRAIIDEQYESELQRGYSNTTNDTAIAKDTSLVQESTETKPETKTETKAESNESEGLQVGSPKKTDESSSNTTTNNNESSGKKEQTTQNDTKSTAKLVNDENDWVYEEPSKWDTSGTEVDNSNNETVIVSDNETQTNNSSEQATNSESKSDEGSSKWDTSGTEVDSSKVEVIVYEDNESDTNETVNSENEVQSNDTNETINFEDEVQSDENTDSQPESKKTTEVINEDGNSQVIETEIDTNISDNDSESSKESTSVTSNNEQFDSSYENFTSDSTGAEDSFPDPNKSGEEFDAQYRKETSNTNTNSNKTEASNVKSESTSSSSSSSSSVSSSSSSKEETTSISNEELVDRYIKSLENQPAEEDSVQYGLSL